MPWAVKWGLVTRLRHVPHEERLGPSYHSLVGTPATLVSNQTEFNGDSDDGHDYLMLRLSSEMYSFKSEAVNQSSSFFIICLKSSHDVCLMQFSKARWNQITRDGSARRG